MVQKSISCPCFSSGSTFHMVKLIKEGPDGRDVKEQTRGGGTFADGP